MNRSLGLLGITMILLGVLVSIISEIPQNEVTFDKSFVVTPNAHYYQGFRFSPNVTLNINFQVEGGAVDFIVLDYEEFKQYEANGGVWTQFTGISSPSVTNFESTWKTPSQESHIVFVWNNVGSLDKTVNAIFTINKTTLPAGVTVLSFLSLFIGIAVLSFSIRGLTPECSRSVRAHIAGGYIFAILGGLVGVLLGTMLLFRKDSNDQLHGTERFYGKIIIAIGVSAFLVYAIYFNVLYR
jgi:hypothetical protein